MMDEKLRILCIFYAAVCFMKKNGQLPKTRQEVVKYIIQVNNKSKRQGSEVEGIDLPDYEFSDDENEIFYIIYDLAEDHKCSPAFFAEIFGYAIYNTIQSNATGEERIISTLDGYLDEYSCKCSGLIAELYQQMEVSHEIRKR